MARFVNILVLNTGSSSLKIALYDTRNPEPLWSRHQEDDPRLGSVLASKPDVPIDAVGHRIVHGGSRFRDTIRITPDVKNGIAQTAEIAPAHNRHELAGIEAAQRMFGVQMPQFAVFDTAFHATLPQESYVYPGPYEWIARGIRRYGFHGISHQYTSRRAAQVLNRDPESLSLITCHLGNGCSLAAIRNGQSIDTTMGFTPLDGLMMGTRSGSVDPGILFYLQKHSGVTADDLDATLNNNSGLLGLSGNSGDMREIEKSLDQLDPRATLAFDVYIHRLRGGIGAMLASLNGADAIVFTAGVGENSARVRAATCRALGFLGVRLDASRNAKPDGDCEISAADSSVKVLVIHTREEWEIAQQCARMIEAGL